MDLALSCQVVAAEKRTYEVMRLGPEHLKAILKNVRENFFQDEPLQIALGLCKTGDFTGLQEYIVSHLGHGFAVGAVAPDGALIGVAINSILTREEDDAVRQDWEARAHEVPDDQEDVSAKGGQLIGRMLDQAAAESNVFARHPGEERLLELCILSVSSQWRGLGVATRLVEATRDAALSDGLHLLRVSCTSHFSALAVSRLGFHRVHTLEYRRVRDRRGRQLVSPAPPHHLGIHVHALHLSPGSRGRP